MSFQIDLDPFEKAYAHFSSFIRDAIQRTFIEEESNSGLTRKEIADTLGVDPALVTRRLNGPGNITLRTLSDFYTAMGREPLSNFEAPYQQPRPEIQTSTSRRALSVIDDKSRRWSPSAA